MAEHVYIVSGWKNRYEPAERLTNGSKSALKFVKLNVFAPKIGPGFADLMSHGGLKGFAAFGLFCKMLEMVGANPRDQRDGRILDHLGQPADANYISRITISRPSTVKKLLGILLEVGWITVGPEAGERRAGVGQASPDRPLTEQNSNLNSNSNGSVGDPTARAAAMLREVGLSEADADPLAKLADGNVERVETACRNAKALRSMHKLGSLGGYLRRAIEQGFEPVPAVAKADSEVEGRAKRAEEHAQAVERQRVDRLNLRQQEAEAAAGKVRDLATIAALGPEEQKRIRAVAIEQTPGGSLRNRMRHADPESNRLLRRTMVKLIEAKQAPRETQEVGS